MAFTYAKYSDNAETIAADKKRKETEASKPGDFSYNDYTESDVVRAAQEALNQHMANQPGAYQSQWEQGLNDTMNKILNREKFSYDLNGDMLYQQYKDQYVNQGKMAMMDTMGQAAAMTGGYGNSYAQSVGQQTYQGYLQQLNDKVPELYQLALDKYNMEGEELYNQYGLFADRDDRDYGRYRDTVADWQVDRDYLTGRYDTEADRDYGRYVDGRDFAYGVHRDDVADYYTAIDMLTQEFWNQRNFGYGQYSDNRDLAYNDHRNTIEDQQWQQSFDEGVRQFNAQLAEEQRQANLSASRRNNNDDDEDEDEGEGGGGGFTGSTYSEAVAYMKANGVDGGNASGIMTRSEFARWSKKGEFENYQDYLNWVVEYKTSGN